MSRSVSYSHHNGTPAAPDDDECIITVYPRGCDDQETNHFHTVILLHDLGSKALPFSNQICDDEAYVPYGTLWELFPTIKWVFPAAPRQFSTRLNETTPQWFDVLNDAKPWDRPDLQLPGLTSNFKKIRDLIDNEAAIAGANNIVLGGTGQGGALALAILMSTRVKLGGYLGLSAFMPLMDRTKGLEPDYEALAAHTSRTNLTTPIYFMPAMGSNTDPNGKNSGPIIKALMEIGMNVGYDPGSHGPEASYMI